MTIIASCGHDITNKEGLEIYTMEFFTYYSSEEKIKRGVMFGVYCNTCAENFEKWGVVLHNEEEMDRWTSGEAEYPQENNES